MLGLGIGLVIGVEVAVGLETSGVGSVMPKSQIPSSIGTVWANAKVKLLTKK